MSGTFEETTLFLSLNSSFSDSEGVLLGAAHSGMFQSAIDVRNTSREKVEAVMNEFSDYKLIVTGHSLGGGAAVLVTLLYLNDTGIDNDRVREVYFRCDVI